MDGWVEAVAFMFVTELRSFGILRHRKVQDPLNAELGSNQRVMFQYKWECYLPKSV